MKLWLFGVLLIILTAGCTQNFDIQNVQKGADNFFSNGLGNLCSGDECDYYCYKHSLDCEEYCMNNQQNAMCKERFSFVFDYKIDPTLAPGYAKCYPTTHQFYRTGRTFVIDPANPDTMYVSVEYKGLYKSVDGGKTWKQKSDGIRGVRREDDRNKPCLGEYFTIKMDPTNPKRLLVPGGAGAGLLNNTYWVGGLQESTDGGESWHQLAHGWMAAYGLEAVIDPANQRTIYYTTSSFSGEPGVDFAHDPNVYQAKGIVYKTTDGGRNWEELQTGFYPQNRGARLFMNPQDSSHLVLMSFALKGGSSPNKTIEPRQQGIAYTKDAGRTWNQMTSLPEGSRAIGDGDISENNLNHIFASTAPVGGVEPKSFYSLDGETFKETDSHIGFARYDLHDKTGMRLVGFNIFEWDYGGENILESMDGGATWHTLGPWPKEVREEIISIPFDTTATQKVRMSNIVFHPTQPQTLFITGNFGYVWKSTDNGRNWNVLLGVDKLQD